MAINNRTSSRDYAKPNVANLLSEDVVRLSEALDSIDTDVAALQSKAPLASPALTGTPSAPTAAIDTNTTQVATTAFVLGQASAANPVINGTAAVGSSSRYARADHIHPTDTTRAPVASPTFTGTPAAPTPAADTNTTQLATTAFVVGQDYTKQTRTVFAGAGLTGGGDLSANRTLAIANGGVTSAMIADGAIVNADISNSAAIADTKLATISTAGKVSNSATTATSAKTASAIVARDASGNFAAGDITIGDKIIHAGNTNTAIRFPAASTVTVETNGDERMRVAGNGTVLFGKSVENDTDAGSRIAPEGIASFVRDAGTSLVLNRLTSDGITASFRRSGTQVGSISVTASATAYNTSSDYRLKENITPLDGAIARLNQLPVHRFNFIADPDTVVDGFIAHEAAAVVPECVTGEKDEVDEDGDPVYQGIDQSKVVPLLTAALQEAIAMINALEARIAALEA